MNFIKLTTQTGTVLHINMDIISVFRKDPLGALLFESNDGSHFHVKESPEQILELMSLNQL